MNETQLDKIFHMLEEGYYESLDFAQDKYNHESDDAEDSFRTLFKDKFRKTLVEIREFVTNVAWEEESK